MSSNVSKAGFAPGNRFRCVRNPMKLARLAAGAECILRGESRPVKLNERFASLKRVWHRTSSLERPALRALWKHQILRANHELRKAAKRAQARGRQGDKSVLGNLIEGVRRKLTGAGKKEAPIVKFPTQQ